MAAPGTTFSASPLFGARAVRGAFVVEHLGTQFPRDANATQLCDHLRTSVLLVWPGLRFDSGHGQPAANLFRKHAKSFTFSSGAAVEASQLA